MMIIYRVSSFKASLVSEKEVDQEKLEKMLDLIMMMHQIMVGICTI
jgi:hypothetical protein